MSRIKSTLRMVSSQFFRLRRHLLFGLQCSDASDRNLLEGEVMLVLTEDNLRQYESVCREVVDLNSDNEEYIADVAKGKMVLIVVSVQGRVVHYSYLMMSNRTICLLGLPPHSALMGNAYTVPEYRGKGCQGRSIQARAYVARQAGFKGVYAETSPENIASQRGMLKGGMDSLGRLNYAQILRFIVIRLTRPKGFPMLSWCS